MLTKILNRWTGAVIFECECGLKTQGLRLGFAAKAAISVGVRLTGANLTDADLTRANLTVSDLTRADLTHANLTRADLTDANLTGSDLTRADLTGSDLTDADLTDANLTPIRDDIWAILSSAPREVPSLRLALIEGRVNGSTYGCDGCGCLVGTLAIARGSNEYGIPGLSPDSSRAAERFFMGIKLGDKPETNPIAKLALQWVDEWLANVRTLVGV